MDINLYLSFIAAALAVTILPGPNNVLLLSVAGQSGFKRCLPLIAGIWSGLLAVMIIAGSFCTALGSLIPRVVPVFKYLGAAYIIYLAVQSFIRKPVSKEGSVTSVPGFVNGFLLQFLNIKVIMLGLATYPVYFLPLGQNAALIILFAVSMTLCCGAGNLLWALAGSVIFPFYNRRYRMINLVMALLLLYCAIRAFFS